MIMNRLTMLAVTLMASIACFAQGNSGEATEWGQNFGPDYQELKYDVTVGSPFQVSVIGFSDAVVNDPTIMNNPPDKDGVTIVAHKVVVPHWLPGDASKASVWNKSVQANAFKSVDAELAGYVTTLAIGFEDNELINGAPVAIGENAFSGLTSLATVISDTPSEYVTNIPESAFAASVYENATLIVPDGAMGKYNTKEGWQKFLKITDSSGYLLGDLNKDGKFKSKDYKMLVDLVGLKKGDDGFSEYADLDGNGKITNKDLKLLLDKM